MQNRDNRGRFARSKKFGKILVWIIILGAIIVGSAKLYQTMYPKMIYKEIEVDVSDKMFAQKIDSLEKSVVKQVESCESVGFKESDALVTYDPTNTQRAVDSNNVIVDKGQMSYGVLQFKTKTVQYYYKSLYGKTLTNLDAILVALNASSSEALAQDIMFTSPKMGLTDWTNCSNRLNLEVLIVAIKKIK
jgi:multidrug efflux pump subunit AcrA (membrane-fusion protein)